MKGLGYIRKFSVLKSELGGRVPSSADGRLAQKTRLWSGCDADRYTARLDVASCTCGGTLGVAGGGGGAISLEESLAADLDDTRQFFATLGIDALAEHADLAVQRDRVDVDIFETPYRKFSRRVHSTAVASTQRDRREWSGGGGRVCSWSRSARLMRVGRTCWFRAFNIDTRLILEIRRWFAAFDVTNWWSASDRDTAVVLLHWTNLGYRFRFRFWLRFRF